MFNLFNRQTSNKNNSEPPQEESSINLDFKFNVNLKGEVLIKILPYLLGGSMIIGGATYSIYNNLPATETNNNPISQESGD